MKSVSPREHKGHLPCSINRSTMDPTWISLSMVDWARNPAARGLVGAVHLCFPRRQKHARSTFTEASTVRFSTRSTQTHTLTHDLFQQPNIHQNNSRITHPHPHTLSLFAKISLCPTNTLFSKSKSQSPQNGEDATRLQPQHGAHRDARGLPQIRPLRDQARRPRPPHHRPGRRQPAAVLGLPGARAGLLPLGGRQFQQVRVLHE